MYPSIERDIMRRSTGASYIPSKSLPGVSGRPCRSCYMRLAMVLHVFAAAHVRPKRHHLDCAGEAVVQVQRRERRALNPLQELPCSRLGCLSGSPG